MLKQLETRIEWDDLVWKATAPFFLIFGREAAVKHPLLESENPKYLGTDKGMINIELMTKLYHIVVHNLNRARKARDGNKKGKTPKEPEKLKVGDNILVRDHTSKAFQPKYKDFCIIGLLGKNQVEIKDHHGHTTKVHHRDIKKIPMTEKVCKLYEEEQVGKTREGRKAEPANKIPDLGWDIAEAELHQETQRNNCTHMTIILQTIIAMTILLAMVIEHIATYTMRIPKMAEKMAQAVKSMITKASRNKLFQNIKDSYKRAALVITIATKMKDCTSRSGQPHKNNRIRQNYPGMWKLNDDYDSSYQPHTSRTHNNNDN